MTLQVLPAVAGRLESGSTQGETPARLSLLFIGVIAAVLSGTAVGVVIGVMLSGR